MLTLGQLDSVVIPGYVLGQSEIVGSYIWYFFLYFVVVLRAVHSSCHAREGGRVKASREWLDTLWGLCAALLPAPHPRCVHGSLWPCAGTMFALSKNVLYVTYTCYLILFFFLSFCWQNFVGHEAYCLLTQD